ncbi:MAG: sigma-70 family RNA polymerase sigma factor [Planctomycetes bacterium]|nr:sigma-70 family RNA polymerase sigma factor [Planctomycetota bacterium]
MSEDPDFELIRRCQRESGAAGEAAFRALFDLYRDRVFNLASRLLGNPADAEDVSQEAFVTVFRKLGEFRFSSRFYTWLYRVVFNLCVDHRRKSNAVLLPTTGGDSGESLLMRLADPEPDPSRTIAEGEERTQQVERALRRLSEPLRAAVVLRYMEDMPYEEIADVLGISLGTVKSRLNRAHQQLQELLERGVFGPRSDRPGAAERGAEH